MVEQKTGEGHCVKCGQHVTHYENHYGNIATVDDNGVFEVLTCKARFS